MRLFITRPSPYARKAWTALLHLGLDDRIEVEVLPARLPTVAKPDLEPVNPLGKVPALVLDDGGFIVDSPVIVAWMDFHGGGGLIPTGEGRWRVLTLEALADGCIDAGVVLRLEGLKEASRQDPEDLAAHAAKIERTLDLIEGDPRWLEGPLNAGQLALVCALDWLIFRELVAHPLASRPRLGAFFHAANQLPALAATRPA